jgi:hypothetical protein
MVGPSGISFLDITAFGCMLLNAHFDAGTHQRASLSLHKERGSPRVPIECDGPSLPLGASAGCEPGGR